MPGSKKKEPLWVEEHFQRSGLSPLSSFILGQTRSPSFPAHARPETASSRRQLLALARSREQPGAAHGSPLAPAVLRAWNRARIPVDHYKEELGRVTEPGRTRAGEDTRDLCSCGL